MPILYYILYAFIWTVTWLPLRVLYLLSDVMFVLVYYVVKYRLKVVRKNLKNSFPEKTDKERKQIEHRFYRHFCDVFVETIKLLHISEKEMMKRMIFTNMDEVNQRIDRGENIMFMLGHYCNWEFMVGLHLFIPNKNVDAGGIYRRIKNPYIDRFYLLLRSRFDTLCIEKNDLFREVIKHRKANRQLLFALMSDQTPSRRNIHYWTNFLNQETPVLIGAERIAKQTGYTLYYVDLQKIGRGYYKGNMVLLSDDVKNTQEFELTEKFVRHMETTILRAPAYWLWTHKRWKHKRTI